MAEDDATGDPFALRHLPLTLRRSEIVPPAPTRSSTGSTVDWILDFAGYAWVAYGASSLLVIAHLPKPPPLSRHETIIGPILRQVFELPHHVSAVSWSLNGDVAAASGNCIFLYSPDSSKSLGSFCWSQSAVLRQSTEVGAVKWTESGDGIVAAGIEVVLWRTKSTSWEIAWKSKMNLPQTLASTTWSIDGPSATAAYPVEPVCEESRSVLVYRSDGRHGYSKAELCHPCPVVTIQWRPSTGRRLKRNLRTRHLLLTCCIDGIVRIWAEIDQGRPRRMKDVKDSKASQYSFSVVAVIETNYGLNGSLGASLLVMWAVETECLLNLGGEVSHIFSADSEEHGHMGQCEWLVGLGPEMKITFWAIHCIDEFSPLRYPRVTLWKTKDLHDHKAGHFQTAHSESKVGLPVKKVFISRNSSHGPPVVCSFLNFSSCSSLFMSLVYNKKDQHKKDSLSLNTSSSEELLSCEAGDLLSIDGHSGKILQIAVHPYCYNGGVVVSLDSNGLLLFWLFSTVSGYSCIVPTSLPIWRLAGRMEFQENCPRYTSLRWAPSILDDDQILLLGHGHGIDCFVVRMTKGDTFNVESYRLCTVPYRGQLPIEDSPTDIYSIPLPSTCKKTFKPVNFILLGIWMKGFHAMSWEISIHSYDLSQSCCGCDYEGTKIDNSNIWKCESVFAGRRYCLSICPCSSQFPYPHNLDLVTSCSTLSPDGFFPYVQQEGGLTMVTGLADGSAKVWRSSRAKTIPPSSDWELVGAFGVQQGPVNRICLADCGQKVATVCSTSNSDSKETLYIWEPMNIIGAGCFVLEHTVCLTGRIVSMKWLSSGNGDLMLGVCMQEKLQIYAQSRFGSQDSSKIRRPSNMQIWSCIAEAHIHSPVFDFFWGPGSMAAVVHHDYICSYGQWLIDQHHDDALATHEKKRSPRGRSREGGGIYGIFTDPEICNLSELSLEGSGSHFMPRAVIVPWMKCACEANCTETERVEQNNAVHSRLKSLSMLEVVEELCGSLPVYHPHVLYFNLYSGNWRRACVALRHLLAHLSNAPGKRCTSSDSGHSIPQIVLSSYLEGAQVDSSTVKGFQWGGGDVSVNSSFQFQVSSIKLASETWSHASTSPTSKYGFDGIAESLEKYAWAAGISDKEKRGILAITNLLNEISDSQSSSVYESLDEPGRRFWIAVKYQQLQYFQETGKMQSLEELVIESETVCWAFHSDCQETLLSSFLSAESSWKELRVMGVGLWYNDVAQLRTRMEKLARLQYLKKKDPKDCALLYIALNRLQVLAGLFKISKDEKDKPLVGFLSRNFQEEKNKAAALKNAYVLLGRHQWELAIAFFLLGGDPSSAINICSKNLGDEQLALVLCRLVEGSGGPLERHLIAKSILPSAIEKDDYWLASLLEWKLGNYSRSIFCMLGVQNHSSVQKATLLLSRAAFLDPKVGLYCRFLTSKNCLKNTVGEHDVAILCRWATLLMATALRRRGLHVEALECLSSLSFVGGSNHGNPTGDGTSEVLPGILEPTPSHSTNWLSTDVALHLETCTKFDLATHHFSRYVRQHPFWPDANIDTAEAHSISNSDTISELEEREQFLSKLCLDLEAAELKFQLHGASLLSRIVLLPCNYGVPSIAYDLLQGYKCHEKSHQTIEELGGLNFSSLISRLSSSLSDDVSILFSRLTVVYGISCSSGKGSRWLFEWRNDIQDLSFSLRNLRTALDIFCGSCSEDSVKVPAAVIDLIEFSACFAFSWYRRDSKALSLMLKPILVSFSDGHIPYEVNMADLKKISKHIFDEAARKNDNNVDCIDQCSLVATSLQHENGGNTGNLIPEDERWQILGVSMWKHVLRFTAHKLKATFAIIDEENTSVSSLGEASLDSSAASFDVDGKNAIENIKMLSLRMAQLLITTFSHVSSYQVKELDALFRQTICDGCPAMVLGWLESGQLPQGSLHEHLTEGKSILSLSYCHGEISMFRELWDSWADPRIVSESFAEEKINLQKYARKRQSTGWKEIHRRMMAEKIELDTNEDRSNSIAGSFESASPLKGSQEKGLTVSKEITPFQFPREICKRNGELLEALCINSTGQQQIAVSSHRKGIIFMNWEESPFKDAADSIWSEADWPQNGWAGSESTPVPTCVSPGVGLGSKKGAHLGLGGATIGTGSSARPGRDLTGGGAFGVPGYAGVGASGLGWEVQEDFEDLVERPATVETIRTRAFSSHPSMPYFLVGSSNTHIYLWEFGKEKATATYGVLPSANVPPPYSLASVSAVQFDHCGHRFCTAALDGTICTWQLEVGGRSNIHPTDSSICFNGHATDITYVTSSGSIIVAAGSSSNNVNVVIWDTLAPPSTSRASIVCHEGGARSISVFDSEIGSSSVSPLILTGGKGGDVGLHDFRYIATGKSKRLRHPGSGEQSSTSSSGTAGTSVNGGKHGIENVDGMLWYLPKAHLGSVTKISRVPNTSLFLTGSKDGDVKLWDVKNAKLVHHWPKLHDRHTFLQPSTRGFGGVVRAGVTDVKVISRGFLSCGGDGTVKLVQLGDHKYRM